MLEDSGDEKFGNNHGERISEKSLIIQNLDIVWLCPSYLFLF